jgi:hypothetical protein
MLGRMTTGCLVVIPDSLNLGVWLVPSRSAFQVVVMRDLVSIRFGHRIPVMIRERLIGFS